MRRKKYGTCLWFVTTLAFMIIQTSRTLLDCLGLGSPTRITVTLGFVTYQRFLYPSLDCLTSDTVPPMFIYHGLWSCPWPPQCRQPAYLLMAETFVAWGQKRNTTCWYSRSWLVIIQIKFINVDITQAHAYTHIHPFHMRHLKNTQSWLRAVIIG